jgi:hypothetical protein
LLDDYRQGLKQITYLEPRQKAEEWFVAPFAELPLPMNTRLKRRVFIRWSVSNVEGRS